MGRILLILFFCLNVKASTYLFIFNQNDQAFIRDADSWSQVFKRLYPDINIMRLKDYNILEAAKLVQDKSYLSSEDTLFFIITSHMLPNESAPDGARSCLLLNCNDNELPDLNKDVIWQYTLKYWITFFSQNKVKVIVFLNTCQPYLVLDAQYILKNKDLTVIYATDKDYCILDRQKGSLLYQTFCQYDWMKISDFISYASESWRQKEYYNFTDSVTDINAMEFYPIRPIIIGKEFYF